MPSEVETAIATYRKALLASEQQATLAIGEAYKGVRSRLIERLDELARLAVQDDPTVTASERARTLLAQVEAEMTRLAARSQGPITAGQQAAVTMAGPHAQGMAAATAQAAGESHIAATITGTWNRLNTGAVESLVGRMSDGSPLRSFLAELGPDTSSAITRALTDAVATGLNPRAVATRLAGQVDVSAARLLAISRTEILGAYRTATLQNYREQGSDILDGWLWTSAHQSRTCLSCLALDGTLFPLTTTFMATHTSCRCSSRPKVSGVDDPAMQTGRQWFDAQPDAVKRQMVPVSAYDDLAAGRLRLDDFVHLDRNDRWGDRYRQGSITQAKEAAKKRVAGVTLPQVAEVQPRRFVAVPQITSRKDAEQYFTSIGVTVENWGGAKETWQLVANAYADELTATGSVPGNLRFKAGSNKGDVAAYARSVNTSTGDLISEYVRIYSNSTYWKDPDSVRKQIVDNGFWSSEDPNHPIVHEFGHWRHAQVITQDKFGFGFKYDGQVFSNKSFGSTARRVTAQKVSRYGATSPPEFIAETYAGLRSGNTYDQDVMDLYRLYGGPEVKQSEPRKRKAS